MANEQLRFPATSVDVVLLTLIDGTLHVALNPRPEDPFKGDNALVGGIVKMDFDRDLDATVKRVLKDKTGLSNIYVEQLYTFGSRDRDPRGFTIAVSYMALVPKSKLDKAEQGSLTFKPVDKVGKLAFDHKDILDVAIQRLRGKGAYSTLPARFLPQTFSLGEMMRVYEQVLGTKTDLTTFSRKIKDVGLVEPTGERRRIEGSTRPSEIFRLKKGVETFDRRL